MALGPEQAEGRILLKLLAMPHVWIKLSAPYRVSKNPLATRPDPLGSLPFWRPLPTAVFGAAIGPTRRRTSEQFGSNVLGVYRNLRYETLVDGFMAAVGSAELAEPMLADNPARLYEF